MHLNFSWPAVSHLCNGGKKEIQVNETQCNLSKHANEAADWYKVEKNVIPEKCYHLEHIIH